MSKTFNEQERTIIREKLIESCKECWAKYGYKKTNVSELCRMAGISTGAFYLFFSSKEMLFIEAAQEAGNKLTSIMEDNLPSEPTKWDFARNLKTVFKEIEKAEWLLTIREDFEIFVRKLPADFFEQDFKQDFIAFSSLVEKYRLISKVDMEIVVTSFQLLFITLLHKKNLAGKTDEAIEFLIDIFIQNSFE